MTGAALREAEELRERGEIAAARRRCEQLVAREPGNAAALNLLAALAADQGDAESGLHWVDQAAAADPRAPAPHYTAGRIHQAEGRVAEAEAAYRRSLALDPEQPKAHNNLGCVLQLQSRLDEAIASFRRALALDPGLAQAKQNLASLVPDRRALEEAAEGYRRLAAANPADSDACNNLGNVYRELGLHREAVASFGEAIRREPQNAEAHYSRGMELLLLGEFEEGWREHEWRWKVKARNTPLPPFAQPLWDGAPLPGGTLLLHAEQGLGDALQFLRYAPLAAARCKAVMLQCQAPLVALAHSVPGVSQVIAQGAPLPQFDAHLPLLSLPHVFRTGVHDIPWSGPYVHPDPSRIALWRDELRAQAGLHVGLAWAGRPQYWDDRKRSMSLAALAPLAHVGGVRFHSLQWGEAAAQPDPEGMALVRYGDRIRDFADMAALVAALDLVISVDTAVNHLAGAMGVQSWLLLAHAPDWRWMLEREDSPWYPTVRIFRQQAEGDWAPVVERVAAGLA